MHCKLLGRLESAHQGCPSGAVATRPQITYCITVFTYLHNQHHAAPFLTQPRITSPLRKVVSDKWFFMANRDEFFPVLNVSYSSCSFPSATVLVSVFT